MSPLSQVKQMRHDPHVVKALLSAAFFLAQSEDGAIDGDHAIFELDAIAANLQDMDSLARKGFVTLLDQLADAERHQALAGFIRTFAEDNGLVV
jgi:acid stress-induced BolA-like protein IbaG/YrbA